ncbi:MAG: hypothetical protein GY930_01030 [bacterium]|nr:hypothetical protein [bacterium]
MLKVLAPLVFILLAGGIWWLAQAGDSDPLQQGLEQDPVILESEAGPIVAADLAAPDMRTRITSKNTDRTPVLVETHQPDPVTAPDEDLPQSGSVMMVRALIVDWNSQPVRNTKLTIGYAGPMRYGDSDLGDEATSEVTSDSEGRIQTEMRFLDLKWKQVAVFVADHDRQAQGWVEPVKVLIDGRGDLGTIQIYEAREKFPTPLVTGRVLAGTGEPLAPLSCTFSQSMDFDVEISGFSSGSAEAQFQWDRESGQVIMAEDGHFQAYGSDAWKRGQLTALSPGYVNASEYLSSLPASNVQLTLYRRLQLEGKLIVPDNGPPVEEYSIWVSQKLGGTNSSPNADGTFSGQGTSQTLNLKVFHPPLRTVLFEQEFQSAPTEEGGLGIIDLTAQVQVVSLTLTDLQGNLLANEGVTLGCQEPSLTQKIQTGNQGELLLVLPRQTPAIQLVRHHDSPMSVTKQLLLWRMNSEQATRVVEFLLPASPSKVSLP